MKHPLDTYLSTPNKFEDVVEAARDRIEQCALHVGGARRAGRALDVFAWEDFQELCAAYVKALENWMREDGLAVQAMKREMP